MKAYVHSSHYRPDGSIDAMRTFPAEVKRAPMPHHNLGLMYTSSGYGSRIPTEYMVRFNGRWRRVYCRQYSNNGTLYVGQLRAVGERLIVQINDWEN